MINPLSFTSRTFNTIYVDLKTKYPDKPEWWVVMLAGLFDILHWYLDAFANNTFLATAITPEAVDNLLAYIDYFRSTASCSSVVVEVTLSDSCPLPYTFPREQLKFAVVKPDQHFIQMEGIAEEVFTTATKNVTIFEGRTIFNQAVGVCDGSAFQEFDMPDIDYLGGSASVSIGATLESALPYTPVDFLVESESTDAVYRVIRLPNGFSRLRFGDGVTGKLPTPGHKVWVTARFGGGTKGNFLTSGAAINYAGASPYVTGTTFVSAAASGGGEEETIDTAREIAPPLIRVNSRAVTERDFELLSLKFSTGISRVKVLPSYYGSGTVGIHIVPTGGGDPSTPLKTALQNYLIPITTLGRVDVRVRTPNYQAQGISAGIKMKGTKPFATAQALGLTFMKILVSEMAIEIYNTYRREGIAAAVTKINAYYGNTYTSTDYPVIEKLLINVGQNLPNWGVSLNPGDIYQLLEAIPNVSYSEVYTPASTITIAEAITFTAGTMSLVQL